ncbi:MAG: hypothetical protein GY950_28380, partial [bacterium]|nr:hypothetical protein [bacterium]
MKGKKWKDGSHVLELWFVFFAAVVVAYVLFNKPLLRVVLNLRPIIFGLVFMVSFSGIGAPFARLLPGRGGRETNHSKIDHFLLSSALGIGLTGLFVFLTGIFGIIDTMLYSLWVLAGLASFGYTVYRHWRPLSFHIDSDIKQPLNMFALLVLVPFILQLIPPLVTPPVSVDALEYHLLIPKTYLMMGKIGYIPSLVESNYPVLVEYIYLLVMPLAGDIVC